MTLSFNKLHAVFRSPASCCIIRERGVFIIFPGFLDGFYHRQDDHPSAGTENYIRYTVQVTDFDEGIVFYKSKPTERWWMEIKCTDNIREKYRRHYIVPCSAADYQTALADEIPDRWWQAYQKLM